MLTLIENENEIHFSNVEMWTLEGATANVPHSNWPLQTGRQAGTCSLMRGIAVRGCKGRMGMHP